jgi:acyl transferase domain-containing protein
MGRELALNFPAIRESYSKIDDLFKNDGLTTISEAVYAPPTFTDEASNAQNDALMQTQTAQPAIGALSAGLYKTLTGAGFTADFAAGHSFGELTALWAADAMSDDDYYALMKARGLAMSPPDDPNFDAGTMLAVMGDLSNLEKDVAGLTGVEMANINSPGQVVLAGDKTSIQQAEQTLAAKGYNVTPLTVAAAFHTPLVGHAQKPFAKAVSGAKFSKSSIPVYSNASGEAYPDDPKAIQKVLGDQILNAVQFSKEIENIYAAGGQVFVEFGPRNVLTNLVNDILGDKPHTAIALNPSRQKDSDTQFREAGTQLRVLGMDLQDVDPYVAPQAETQSAGKRKGMKIQINGGSIPKFLPTSYTSE